MEEMTLEREVVAGSRLYQILATAMPDGRTAICLRSGAAGSTSLNELSGTIAKEDLAMIAAVFRPELAAIAAWHGVAIDESTGALARRRMRHPNAYTPWSDEQEQIMIRMFEAGSTVYAIAKKLGRQPGAISARLEKLGLNNPST